MSTEREVGRLPEPVDVRGALVEIAELLAELGIEPVLIGGVALGVHGIERFTKDVDLALTMDERARVEASVQDRDPRPLVIGGVSVATRAGVRVDLIDRRLEYRALFEEAIAAARQRGKLVVAGGQQVAVVPLDYLVALKMAAGRPMDEADISQLVARDDLDYPRTRDIVHRHLGPFGARWLDRQARAAGRRDAPRDYADDPS